MDTTGIPHRPGRLPVIGDLLGSNPRTPLQDTLRVGQQVGPIFTRKIFGFEIVFAGGVDVVTQLNDETKFGKHVGLGIENLRAVAGDGLFTAHTHEPNWRLAHDILQPAFSADAMRRYHPVMLEVAHELTDAWDRASGPVDVAADMTRLTLETIGRAGFGYRFGSFERAEPHPFVTAMIRALRFAQLQNVKLPFVRRAFAGSPAQNQADIATMNNLVDEVIEARRREGGESRDLLGLMLTEGHPMTGERLDPVNIRNQAITFVVAGHETTSGALSFALYYLTRNPEVLAKARAEVDAVWGDREPGFGDVAKLRYVRRVLDEAMRLWPTAPGYSREAREDVLLGGKYRMRKGDWVIVPLPLVHRDPAVWGPDPEKFDPDRFEPAAVKKRPAQSYKPFGTGERACIGRQFALHEAVLALGMVVQRYDFEADPAYELKIAESLTLKPSGFTVRPRARARAAVQTS
ncbi:cytochrome P450 [Amycolatopsis sp. NPDC049253]|uniref:cytochrome P450 n=1 Tax=Amycolatopsis sp. NPDC049253 TaxID=3155274 RepID=UPI0034405F5E